MTYGFHVTLHMNDTAEVSPGALALAICRVLQHALDVDIEGAEALNYDNVEGTIQVAPLEVDKG